MNTHTHTHTYTYAHRYDADGTEWGYLEYGLSRMWQYEALKRKLYPNVTV
jgi:hypothetical protein